MRQSKKSFLNEESEDVNESGAIRHYSYQNVEKNPIDKANAIKKKRQDKKASSQVDKLLERQSKNKQEIFQVSMDSQQYKDFIAMIEEPDQQNKQRLPVCLTCWKFVTEYQKNNHMNNGH